MSTQKKPNAQSPLRILPRERQAQIIEWLNTGTIEAARKQLLDDGFSTSARALSEFRSWYLLREQFEEDRRDTDQFEEELKNFNPALSQEKIRAFGEGYFTKLSIKRADNLEFVRLLREQTRREMAATQKRDSQRGKIEDFIKWYEDSKVRETLAGDDSNDAKTEALGRHIFKEDWD